LGLTVCIGKRCSADGYVSRCGVLSVNPPRVRWGVGVQLPRVAVRAWSAASLASRAAGCQRLTLRGSMRRSPAPGL